MKVPRKETKYKIQLETEPLSFNDSHLSSPKRYRPNKLYQLNMSKMLLRCPQNNSPFLPSHYSNQVPENPEQLLVVSTVFNGQKTPHNQQIHSRNQYSLINKKKFTIGHKKSMSKRFEEFTIELYRKYNEKEAKQKFFEKCQDSLIKTAIPAVQEEEITSYEEKLLISEKVLHGHTPNNRRSIMKNWQNDKVIHIKRQSLNPMMKRTKLPELQSKIKKGSQDISKTAPSTLKPKKNKPEQQNKQSKPTLIINSNVPLLMKDSQQLKIIKSESYAVLQHPNNQLVLSSKGQSVLQIASLTKIMTFYSIRKITEQFSINIVEENIVVTDTAMDMTGTSAEIFSGQVYTIEQLLYGLMLPSGNDAATALAEWAGQYLINHYEQSINKFPALKQMTFQTIIENSELQKVSSRDKLKVFITFMNINAKDLNLTSTKFANPHGLPHPENKSTAVDVCRLCSACLHDSVFIRVASTQKFKCLVKCQIISKPSNSSGNKKQPQQKLYDGTNLQKPTTVVNHKYRRNVEWDNTNKLLRRDNFIGIKTGITVTAGPCLATAYKFRDKVYVTVLLRSTKVSRRFKQTRKILNWCIEKLYANNLTEAQRTTLTKLRKNRPQFDSDYSEEEHEFNYETCNTAEYKKRSNFINFQM